jgi:hypothetical protein
MYPGKNFRLDVLFSPFTNSTTDSDGIRTSVILSPSPSPRTFSSSAVFTLFSYPEYVWTTYHLRANRRLHKLLAAFTRLTDFQQHLYYSCEGPIAESQINRHNHGKNQDHHGGADGFLPRRESDFLQLHFDFPEKLGYLFEGLRYLLYCFLNCHYHILLVYPTCSFIHLNLLAGQKGFEPPTPGFGDRCSNR